MNHTPQIKKALQFAARKHHGQFRVANEANGPLPYVTHLFSTALLVAEDGASDDVVIATLLHDTLEDTDTTRDELAAVFGETVAKLVEAVSEEKALPWRTRKQAYLDQITQASDDALLVAVADKIDNVESRMEEYAEQGEAFFSHWSHPNSDYLWFYGEALRIAQARLPEHPLTRRYAEAHARQLELFAGK